MSQSKISWPNDKKFAFSIVDDTDLSTLESVKPVYEYLANSGLRTTKTVWVYPSRDHYTGDTLQDAGYLAFVKDLQSKGFEIALHNIGSGRFSRAETLAGLEFFKANLGQYPNMQINHGNNPDNIYWGYKRYLPPLRWLMKLSPLHRVASGEEPDSELFWGDAHKQHITYIRNHTFNGINTASYDPLMPYRDKRKERFSNYWFSSSDAHTVTEFNALLTPSSLDHLESTGGLCIAYTHLHSGFVEQDGALNSTFKRTIDDLSSRDGWFVPASEILDYLRENCGRGEFASYAHLQKLDLVWVFERIAKELRFRLHSR